MAHDNRILIVEDNDFVRMQLVRFLEEVGYGVIETADGTGALERLDEDVALLIVDIRMEPMDGFEFIRAIRGDGIQTPVILVTGDHNPDLLSEAGKWGVSAVLIKPVQRDRLIKTVEKTLRAKPQASLGG